MGVRVSKSFMIAPGVMRYIALFASFRVRAYRVRKHHHEPASRRFNARHHLRGN